MIAETSGATRAVVEPTRRRPYVLVFATLAVVTFFEINLAVFLVPLGFAVSGSGYVAVLIILATFKATLVVSYYMHLRYEPRWLMLIPLASLALVGVLVVALLGTPGLPAPPP